MDEAISHTSFAEQQAFLALTPEQQNLRIYLNGKETNGKLAEAVRDIAELRPMVRRHDFAFKVAAVVFGAIIAIGPFIIAYGPDFGR